MMRRTILKLFIERRVEPDVRFDVMTIDAVQTVGIQPARGHELDQLRGEDDVDVRGEHEPTARPAHPDVLGDHLKERENISATQSGVNLRRHFKEPIYARG